MTLTQVHAQGAFLCTRCQKQIDGHPVPAGTGLRHTTKRKYLMNLDELGLKRYLSRSDEADSTLLEDALADGSIARIIAEHRGAYRIGTEEGESEAVLGGTLRASLERRIEMPTVGDWVAYNGDPGRGRVRLDSVLPRYTVLTRKVPGPLTEDQVLAANVDTVLIVSALDSDRNHGVRGIERYVTAVWESGATPIIALNKSDLVVEVADVLFEIEAVSPGVDIVPTSCENGAGIDDLFDLLAEDTTIAFVGRSGVGKSSLVNCLAELELAGTGAVRGGDHRGRHTTTHRQLTRLESGLVVIDTPGLREFSLSSDDGGLDTTFEDIALFASECKFRDCAHSGEPGCAVQQAIADGAIDHARYESYLKLQRELRYYKNREHQRARAVLNAQNRRGAKALRKIKKG